jgi:hypothetical protein
METDDGWKNTARILAMCRIDVGKKVGIEKGSTLDEVDEPEMTVPG